MKGRTVSKKPMWDKGFQQNKHEEDWDCATARATTTATVTATAATTTTTTPTMHIQGFGNNR